MNLKNVSQNHIYLTGSFSATVDFDPGSSTHNLTSASPDDIFVLKLTTTGNYSWVKSFGGSGSGAGNSIIADAIGNVYSIGTFSGTFDFDPGSNNFPFTSHTSNSVSDIYISKLDSSGNFVWAKQIGGKEADKGSSITLDKWNNIYTTGTFADTVDFDPNAAIVNLTSTHNTTMNLALFPDAYVLKLNNDGNFLWAKRIGGQQFDEGYGIHTDAVGNVYSTGYFNGTANAGSFIVTANNGTWDADVFITKLDSAGNFKWAKSMGGPSADHGNSIFIDNGNVYTTGNFVGPSFFDPNNNTLNNLTAVGDKDAFIHKMICSDTSGSIVTTSACDSYAFNGTTYTSSGSYTHRFANSAGCDSIVVLNLTINTITTPIVTADSVTLSTSTNYATYQWLRNGVAISNANNATYIATENGGYQVAVTDNNGCKDTSATFNMDKISSVSFTHPVAHLIKLHPNPTSDLITISSPIAFTASVISLDGRTVYSRTTSNELHLKQLQHGIYLIKLYDMDGLLIKVEKVVKQ